MHEQVSHSAIASHNDAVLAWVYKIASFKTDDGATARFPTLNRAVEAFKAITRGMIAQTGFLPTGSNAGAKDADVNKPFDVLPFPQGDGFVYAMANPRLSNQDAAVLVAILAALAQTTDETSIYDMNGKAVVGGGFASKKKDAKDDDAQPRVKANNKTFGALLRELDIKKEGHGYTVESNILSGLRSECPPFPTEALALPVPSSRPSGAIKVTLKVTGKANDGKRVTKDLDLSLNVGPEMVLFFLSALPKAIIAGTLTCARPSVVASWSEAYAKAGFTFTSPEAPAKAKAESEMELLTGTE